ncbi:MAG TPA: MerR family transcriptional regulator [Anaerolineales bacterium]|nr:MerR family transcriptional regulator [Anaerolineales bacterium]
MIKIGDFSKLSRVSVKTLRYYDDLGLLTPVQVDSFTGYRYYALEQLPRLNRILALKDLGFSLEQIGQVLNDGLTLEQLRGMLRLKRAEAGQRLAEEQGRLARIEARLRQIELEDKMPDYEVILKQVEPMLVASRRIRIPTNDQVPDFIGPAFDEAIGYAQKQGAKWAGPCFAVWHTSVDTLEDEDAEVVMPIDRHLPGNDRVQVYELSGGLMASVVHQGNFDNFTQGHLALLKWIEANGYRVVGPFREIYHKHDHKNLNDTITEVQMPVEKA